MSKELEYEFNNFANLLHKDCMNLMECLKKQSEDNKPILYLGKHYQKVILPYEEYKKMCNRLEEQEKKTYSDELKLVEKKLQRLESIDNANPSEALECLEYICKILNEKRIDVKWLFKHDYNTIKQALQKAQEPKQYLKWEDLEFSKEVKEMKVKLGDNTYEIEYYICNALGLRQPVVILKTSDFIAITIEQFFNDLHLERVEE